MKQTELIAEVRDVALKNIRESRSVRATWLTHAIVASWGAIEGDSPEKLTLCAYEHVRDTVRQCLREFDGSEEEEVERGQMVLPGYERLRIAYLVTRDKEHVLLPIHDCTIPELAAKAAEYEVMAKGCIAHADELRRYIAEREEQSAGNC